MGQIVAERATLQVGRRELGLTMDKYTRALLRRRLATNLASGSGWKRASTVAAPANLQNWVDAFSESYTLSAVDKPRGVFQAAGRP
jgi:hypothetical protein